MLNDFANQFSIEEFSDLFNKVGTSRAKFAVLIGVSPKTVTNYLTGVHTPSDQKTVLKIKSLMRKYADKTKSEDAAAVEDVAPETVDITLPPLDVESIITPKALKAYQKQSNLSVGQISAQLGIGSSTWNTWVSGNNLPGPKYRPRVQALLAGKPIEFNEKTKPPLKRTITVEKSHTLAQRFFDTHQADINKNLLVRVMRFVAEETQVPENTVRSVLTCSVLLLKDRITFAEIYQSLTGHAS